MPVIGRFVRASRKILKRWSPARDRAFHDELFAAQTHDPFAPSFPGYITIRRFADLASPRLAGLSTALDLGCGTAEITCELARRHPQVAFVGVDHSEAAIARAKQHGVALGLRNVTFECADVATWPLPPRVDIVLMFDSFHHASDPAALVRRVGQVTSRLLLIEPHGDWKGSWRRDIDCDWLVLELEKIRVRLAHLLGEASASASAGADKVANEPSGEPTEHRYSLDDFARFFAGYTIDVRGTVSGLDVYPSNPYADVPTREWFAQIEYESLGRVDEALRQRDLDLLAKHWVIYCERGGNGLLRRVPAAPRAVREALPQSSLGPHGDQPHVTGPYDAEYSTYSGPNALDIGQEALATVRVRNRSWRTWHSSATPPILASYHWLSLDGRVVAFDGPRSPLPHPLGPGDECTVALRIRAPERPGKYLLAFDLVEEGTCWFSDAGVPCLQVPVRIRRVR